MCQRVKSLVWEKKEGMHEPACVVYMLSSEKAITHKIFIILFWKIILLSYKAEKRKKHMCNILIYMKKLIYQFIILKYLNFFFYDRRKFQPEVLYCLNQRGLVVAFLLYLRL